jgi:hypothetical protein
VVPYQLQAEHQQDRQQDHKVDKKETLLHNLNN